ncbi:hypothetical protein LTR08_001175 [Meristemomyces frigidus]|nr:hypothetical protein LTR08_001175 [Meristemomyces frigidus]
MAAQAMTANKQLAAPGGPKMETASAQIGAAVGTFVDGIQEQISELKKSQASLLKEVDFIRSAQHQSQAALEELSAWRESIDAKVNQVETLVTASDKAKTGLHSDLDDVRAEAIQLKGAVDTVLEHHNTLTARVQFFLNTQPVAAVTAVPTSNVQTPDVYTSAVDDIDTRPKTNPAAELPMFPNAVHHAQLRGQDQHEEVIDTNPGKESVRQTASHSTDELHLRLQQSGMMAPPLLRNVRAHSLASSVTLCGDESAEANTLGIRPPLPTAKVNLLTAPVQKKRKRNGEPVARADDIEEVSGSIEREQPLAGYEDMRQDIPDQDVETGAIILDTDLVGSAGGDTIYGDEIRVAVRMPQHKAPKRAKAQVTKPAPIVASDEKQSRTKLVVLKVPSRAANADAPSQTKPGSPLSETPDNLTGLSQQWGVCKGDREDKSAAVETVVVAKEEIIHDRPKRRRTMTEKKRQQDV